MKMINLLAAKGSIIFQINRCVEIFDVEPAVRNAFPADWLGAEGGRQCV